MTNEDYALLTEYKEQLHTALHSDYSRYVPRQVLKRMVEIVRGVDANYKMNPSCSRCVLGILKDAARLYEAEVERLKNENGNGKKRKSKSKA
jgi:hypothetical protein